MGGTLDAILDIRKILGAAFLSICSFAKKHKESLILSLVWIVMALLVDPIGEFPLQDDWLYSHSVMTLLSEKHLQLYDTQTTIAVGMIIWGALFAKIFGFSMTTLRISTLVLGLFGLWGIQRFLKSTGSSSFLAFWGALTLATTPLYFGIANTFMTDIPFYTFGFFSYYCFIRFLQSEKNGALALGIIFASLATITRQIALVIPVSFSIAYLTHKGISRKNLLRTGLLCAIVCGALLSLPLFVGKIPSSYMNKWGLIDSLVGSYGTPLFSKFIFAFFWRAAVGLTYVGFFLSPFLLLFLPSQWRALRRSEKVVSVSITCLYIGFILVSCKALNRSSCLMPYGVNCIRDFAFGPVTLLGNEIPTPAPSFLWIVVTFLGIAGSGVILSNFLIPLLRFFRNLGKPLPVHNTWVWILCAASCLSYYLPWAISGHFDRYFTFYMPLVMFLVINNGGEIRPKQLRRLVPFSLLMILLIGFYSVAGTHDYLGWNKLRWGILRVFMQGNQISPKEIDGGYEFNGWYNYFTHKDPIGYVVDENQRTSTNKSFWWIYDDKYVLSFGIPSGYRLLRAFPCTRWLPPYKAPPLLLLQRIEK